MKKQVGALVGAVVLSLGLVACGGGEQTTTQATENAPQATDTEPEATAAEPEAAAFEEAAAAELAAKQDANEVTMSGAAIAKPDGWYFDSTSEIKVELKADEGSASVKVNFATTDETAFDRAVKFAGNFGKDASEVQTATVNGVEWAFYRPTDTQFDAYAVSSASGVVNARGMSITWEDAQPVMESITIL